MTSSAALFQQLLLGFNELTVEAAEAIIDAINSKANLEMLDLNGKSAPSCGSQFRSVLYAHLK